MIDHVQKLVGALEGTTRELESVLSAINDDRIPHDGDEFHERLQAARAALSEAKAGGWVCASQAQAQPAAMPELPEPELGYIETDKSRQPAFSARQMRAALQAQPAAEVSDAELLDAYNSIDPCNESPQDRLIRRLRAILALRPQAVTSEPGAYESRYAEWRQFYGNRITQWMSADELRLAVSRLMTVDAGSPELLLIHAMHLIDQAAPEWIAGEPANLQAAARDADEWLALIQRLNDAGRWRFSQPDSRTKLDGCRAALSKILCAHAPKAVPMTEDAARLDWMASRSAHIGWDRDGDFCRVWAIEDEEIGQAPITGWHDSARDAIDAARGITAPAGGEQPAAHQATKEQP